MAHSLSLRPLEGLSPQGSFFWATGVEFGHRVREYARLAVRAWSDLNAVKRLSDEVRGDFG